MAMSSATSRNSVPSSVARMHRALFATWPAAPSAVRCLQSWAGSTPTTGWQHRPDPLDLLMGAFLDRVCRDHLLRESPLCLGG